MQIFSAQHTIITSYLTGYLDGTMAWNTHSRHKGTNISQNEEYECVGASTATSLQTVPTFAWNSQVYLPYRWRNGVNQFQNMPEHALI